MTTDDPRRGQPPTSGPIPAPRHAQAPRAPQPPRPPQMPAAPHRSPNAPVPPRAPQRPAPRPSTAQKPVPGEPGADATTSLEPTTGGTLAYSAVPEPAPVSRPASTPAAPTTPPKEAPVTSTAATSDRGSSRNTRSADSSEINIPAIVALILSGLCITAPVGLWLGYRSRAQIDREHTVGREFATAAIIVAYLWIVAVILGLVAYLWILI